MPNTITVNFTTCDPSPLNGYNILYRKVGSGDAFTDAGNFTVSPAVIIDSLGEEGDEYEGIIRSDCGYGVFGNSVPWSTEGTPSTVCRNYDVTNNHGSPTVFGYISCEGVTETPLLAPDETVTICAVEDQVYVDELFTVTPGAECFVPCKSVTLHGVSGTPTAHYLDCNSDPQDTVIPVEGITICTDGHGFIITDGTIIVDSEVEGDC